MGEESLVSWIMIYVFEVLFCLWLIKWGGARYLEWTFKSWFLLSTFAPTWDEEVIKFYAWLLLILWTFWFILGLFIPGMRISWLFL